MLFDLPGVYFVTVWSPIHDMASPPPSPPPLTPEELQQNRGSSIIAGTSVVFTLASVAIILRLWSRRLKRVRLGLDDWLILAAWVRPSTRIYI